MVRARMIIHLHIGTPKSGTTYLQDVLRANRERLATDGVLWPGATWNDQVDAVRDVLGLYRKDPPDPVIVGAWDRLRAEMLAWDGRAVVLSMEWLVHAGTEHVERIVRSLAPHEVRVVVTARDLARGVPAQWQEQVQNWAVWTWEEYLAGITADDPQEHAPGRQFWAALDLGRILRTWSTAVPADRMTVVTVPGRGAAPDALWQRFARVVGVDPEEHDTAVAPSNTSIGAASAEVLRCVNVATRERGLSWAQGDPVLKWILGKGVLGPRRPLEGPIALPRAHREWAERESRRLVEEVRSMGVAVVGDVEELLPDDAVFHDAPAPTAEQLLDAALDGLTGLVMELARRVEQDTTPAPPPPTRLQRVMRSAPMKPVASVGLPVRDALRRLRARG